MKLHEYTCLSNMRNFILVFVGFLLLSGCEESYRVGLYKDKIEESCLLAIFPSVSLEIALGNCESTVILFKEDDTRYMRKSIVTGELPVYYCQKIIDWLLALKKEAALNDFGRGAKWALLERDKEGILLIRRARLLWLANNKFNLWNAATNKCPPTDKK